VSRGGLNASLSTFRVSSTGLRAPSLHTTPPISCQHAHYRDPIVRARPAVMEERSGLRLPWAQPYRQSRCCIAVFQSNDQSNATPREGAHLRGHAPQQGSLLLRRDVRLRACVRQQGAQAPRPAQVLHRRGDPTGRSDSVPTFRLQPCLCPARARGAAVHVYIYSIAPTPPSSNSPLRPSGMNAPWCGRMRSVLACTLLLSVVRTTRAASECAADGGLCAADASLTLDPANAPPALLEAAREAQLFVSGLYHALHRCAALREPVRLARGFGLGFG
jgi:hypothetical protein